MRQYVRHVMGRGKYIISSDRYSFSNTRVGGGETLHRPLDGPGVALRGRGSAEPQVRSE